MFVLESNRVNHCNLRYYGKAILNSLGVCRINAKSNNANTLSCAILTDNNPQIEKCLTRFMMLELCFVVYSNRTH